MKPWYTRIVITCMILSRGIAVAAASMDSVDAEIEKEIRILEQQEVQAVLTHDAATLGRLWDKGYVVHNPEGRIVSAGANVMDRPVFQRARASFIRAVESIVVQGEVVFSMGSESVVPFMDGSKTGEVIKRRYTNVWMRKDGSWKLVARHANKVCSKK